jgi:hypothetical protein
VKGTSTGRLADRAGPVLVVPPAGAGQTVDHVWANIRVFLPGRTLGAACQLGGDGLGPHLSEFAASATVIGPDVSAGPTWAGVRVPADAAPFPDDSFDLVAIADLGASGGRAVDVLGEALRLCRPTGTVVAGFRTFRLGSHARRAIASRSERIVVALPGSRRPAFILDPDDRRAARYFVRRMAFAYRAPGTTGIKARSQSLRNRAAAVVPARVALRGAPGRIGVVAPQGAPTSILSRLDATVRSSWTQLGMPGPAPDRLQPLVVGHRRPETGVVTVLLFPSRGGEPVVAKFPRYGSTNPSLQREEAALQHVSDAVTAPIRVSLPRPLGVHRIDDVDVQLQTGVPGHHLVARTASTRLRPPRVADQLDTVLSWCLELQGASAHERVVDDRLIAERLVPLAAAAVTALGGDPRVSAFLDRTLDQAGGLEGTSLPMVVAHGDYWAGNILVERDRVVGVVDWERATTDDLPIWDPLKAVGSTAYHLDRYRTIPRRGGGKLPDWGDMGTWAGTADPRFATGFRAAFVQPGWLADTSRDALVRTFTRGRIPLGWLPVAVAFYLVRQIVQAGDSPRSVEGWGSVLQALAARPGTWADAYENERNDLDPSSPRGERRIDLGKGSAP